MKHWVLFGVQGDPLIEEDRPTLATLFRSCGYATAMVGKWHLGLRYTRQDGRPVFGWEDADLTKDVFDGPCDHGFDFARFTSARMGHQVDVWNDGRNQVKIKKVAAIRPLSQLDQVTFIIVALSVLPGKESN